MRTPKTEREVARKHHKNMIWALLIAFAIESFLIAGAVGIVYLIFA